MGSKLAFGPSAARYRPIGKTRPSSEKELILCNLLMRKEDFLKHGGFNEKLYPNEENALLDEIQEQGGQLLYDPEIVVYRNPRGTLKTFCKMLMTYGRGRAEQFRLKPTIGSVPNFVPPLFCLFLLLLPFLPAQFLWVLALYYGLVFLQGLALLTFQKLPWIPGIMFLIFLSHVLYGIGFWRGCFTRPKPPVQAIVTEIKIEQV
jgi:succinoglycan biosynthesis protein ExoA